MRRCQHKATPKVRSYVLLCIYLLSAIFIGRSQTITNDENLIDSLRLKLRDLKKEKQELHQHNFVIDSIAISAYYSKNHSYAEFNLNRGNEVKIHIYTPNDSIINYEIFDHCSKSEFAEFEFTFINDKEIFTSNGHSIESCIAYSEEDLNLIMSSKFHFSQQENLDLIRKIHLQIQEKQNQ